MRRLFITSFVVLATAALFVIFGVPIVVKTVLQKPLVNLSSSFAEAPQRLFEGELQRIPEQQWGQYIESLRDKFGYDLDMLELADLDVSAYTMERLVRGEASIDPEIDDVMFLPITNTTAVLRVAIGASAEERGIRSMKGFFYLIERQLSVRPPGERNSYLQTMVGDSEIPVYETPLEKLEPTALERDRLLRGQIVVRDYDSDDETYLKLNPGSGTVLVIGPIRDPAFRRFGIWIALGITALVLAFAILLWLRPLGRDMRSLTAGAMAFGIGHFEQRVAVSQTSPILDVAKTFNAMADRIGDLISAQKELTDAVSHELRTPIARLQFGLTRIEESVGDTDRASAVAAMRVDVAELDQLVDELLTYSRLKDSQPVLRVETVDVDVWFACLLSEHEENQVSIEVEHVTSGLLATLDARLVGRAINNLCRNALRFAQQRVVVSAHASNDGFFIAVDDDGDGVDEEDVQRVFEPFFQSTRQPCEGSSGYGLGLAIVQRICEWHGADIKVVNSSLGGARFLMRFPKVAVTHRNIP
ncbi:MAG: ATP-binding protein [Pseudomonadota bacterium]